MNHSLNTMGQTQMQMQEIAIVEEMREQDRLKARRERKSNKREKERNEKRLAHAPKLEFGTFPNSKCVICKKKLTRKEWHIGNFKGVSKRGHVRCLISRKHMSIEHLSGSAADCMTGEKFSPGVLKFRMFNKYTDVKNAFRMIRPIIKVTDKFSSRKIRNLHLVPMKTRMKIKSLDSM